MASGAEIDKLKQKLAQARAKDPYGSEQRKLFNRLARYEAKRTVERNAYYNSGFKETPKAAYSGFDETALRQKFRDEVEPELKVSHAQHEAEKLRAAGDKVGAFKHEMKATSAFNKAALDKLVKLKAEGKLSKEAVEKLKTAKEKMDSINKRLGGENKEQSKSIETGARGGRYYMSDSGQKVYIKE